MTDSTSTPRFGFVAFAETWNGRLAMLGFVIGLGTELLTGQGILSQIGLG
jgi:ferrochelatase